jgi:hypothetical protein
MNELKITAASTQGACSLHEDGRRLAELQRRVAEAREVVTCACNYATRSEQIAEATKHYGDVLREYRAALESPTGEVSDTATTGGIEAK